MVGGGATRPLRSGYVPPLLEFRILGPLEVVGDDGPVRLGGPKQRAVLAILLLNANRVVSIDRIADDLYGDEMPTSALTQIQAQISHLRKMLDPERAASAPGSLVETRAPGYVIRLDANQLDLRRFERLTSDAAEASTRRDVEAAVRAYREALALWRGPPLDDLADEPFARPAIARLEDLRLAALEERIDCELELGRGGELVVELRALVVEHPLRERMHAQLMRALYASGRQAEALEVYRRLRRMLVEQLGIEPTPALQDLERAILGQDPALGSARPSREQAPSSTILVVATKDDRLDPLLALAAPLAGGSSRELIVVRPVAGEVELAPAAAAANARRSVLDAEVRSAAFISSDRTADALRLIEAYDVELVFVDEPDGLGGDTFPAELRDLLERSTADVAVATGQLPGGGSRVLVPFGGGEHDWAALELGAWLARSTARSLGLIGTRARPQVGRGDASRLLADAAIAVQRLVDIETEPLLIEPAEQELVEAAADALAVVMGVSPRWRREGVGDARRSLLRAHAPLVLVHRGLRPGGLAPRASRTHFTWTLQR